MEFEKICDNIAFKCMDALEGKRSRFSSNMN